MTDGDFLTAWNSATMDEGDTTPQTLTITLPEGVRVRAIGLTAGYTKVDGARDLFTGNRRITRLTIRHGEHELDTELLPEMREIQDIPVAEDQFPGEHGGEWIVELTEWQQGDRPDWRELAVSELRVLGEVGSAPQLPVVRPAAGAMRTHAEGILARYHRDLGQDAMNFETRTLVGEPALQTLSLANPMATLPISLPQGNCYLVIAHVRRRSGGTEEPGWMFGAAVGPNSWDRYPADGDEAVFAAGLDEVICARDNNIRTNLEMDDTSGIEATVAVYRQGVDPENVEDEVSLLPVGETPPGEPTMVAREGLHLTRLIATADVFGRRPGEAQQVYFRGVEEKIYCFFELANPSEAATQLQLAWLDGEGESRREPSVIEVPARRRFVHYRYTNLESRRPGNYACVLRDAEGTELGRAPVRIMDND